MTAWGFSEGGEIFSKGFFRRGEGKREGGRGRRTLGDVAQVHPVPDVDVDVGVRREPVEEEEHDFEDVTVLYRYEMLIGNWQGGEGVGIRVRAP